MVDPVMAAEINDAARLFASNPIAHGQRPGRPFFLGMEYRFRVRGGIVVRLNAVFRPGENKLIVRQMVLAHDG
jgi:hypothetical protein